MQPTCCAWRRPCTGSDVSLREEVRFAKFTRKQRRFLLSLLEGATHLDADLAARPSLFKRLLWLLHPANFTVPAGERRL